MRDHKGKRTKKSVFDDTNSEHFKARVNKQRILEKTMEILRLTLAGVED